MALNLFVIYILTLVSIYNMDQDQQQCVGYVRGPQLLLEQLLSLLNPLRMLKDTVRTMAYQNAIMQNGGLFKDKIVLDVGSGSGILSLFAVKSGAKQVYSIQKGNIYIHTRNIIKENGLEDKITIINGFVEEIVLPIKEVDIIISEQMGYFLLYESMFDSVLYARERIGWLEMEYFFQTKQPCTWLLWMMVSITIRNWYLPLYYRISGMMFMGSHKMYQEMDSLRTVG